MPANQTNAQHRALDRYREVATEHLAESLAFADRSGRLIFVNDAFARLHRLVPGEIVGRRSSELAADAESATRYAELERARAEGRAWSGALADRSGEDGRVELLVTLLPVHDEAGQLIGWVEVGRDIGAERALEAQLRHAVKMEAIGRLAGSVAHDFNNLLTAIRGFAELHVAGHRDEDSIDVIEIMRAADRASELVRQLLTFSRRSAMPRTPVDVALAVRTAEPLLRRLLGEDIAVRFDIDDVPQILVDPGQIEEILLNLAANSRDAMPDGGRFFVRLAPAEPQTSGGSTHEATRRYVVLSVADTGVGIAERTVARIFEPFFTTKDPDKGTGLGLASVRSIVEQADGFIEVESLPGVGTTFHIYLPTTDAVAAKDDVPRHVCGHDGGGERLLLIEDDASVRAFATQALEWHGYSVTAFGDPEEAVTFAESRPETLDGLVTDVVMPGIGGVAVVRRLRERIDILPVLYMSGHDPLALPAELDAAQIAKPFSACELADAVARLFSRQGLA